MSLIRVAVADAPEVFLLLAIAIGTALGRVRIRGFAVGATACILLVVRYHRPVRRVRYSRVA